MVYLDYSATTKVNDEVLESFVKLNKEIFANSNSLHELGIKSNNLLKQANKQIRSLLGVEKTHELISTSGASEANNLAIKGIIEEYNNRGKRIITTKLEHDSINKTLDYFKNKGYEIKYVKLNESGVVDLENLESLINDDTILITIASVSSELGILQPIDKIVSIIKKYPKVFFHSDITQSVGKVDIDIRNVDLLSFSSHKFYGIKGVGGLLKKNSIKLEPLIHGGISETEYRSGTPAVPLIVSTAKALRLSINDLDKKNKIVKDRNKLLIEGLKKLPVMINSTDNSIPHIVNFSILNLKPETVVHALEKYNIYISSKTACSGKKHESNSVLAVTGDLKKAVTSLRVSISYLTTEAEILYFLEKLEDIINKLGR